MEQGGTSNYVYMKGIVKKILNRPMPLNIENSLSTCRQQNHLGKWMIRLLLIHSQVLYSNYKFLNSKQKLGCQLLLQVGF